MEGADKCSVWDPIYLRVSRTGQHSVVVKTKTLKPASACTHNSGFDTYLCHFGQFSSFLYASVSPSIKWG